MKITLNTDEDEKLEREGAAVFAVVVRPTAVGQSDGDMAYLAAGTASKAEMVEAIGYALWDFLQMLTDGDREERKTLWKMLKRAYRRSKDSTEVADSRSEIVQAAQIQEEEG